MTQALLWSALAVLVIIGALMAYGLLDLRKSKSDTTTIITTVTAELRAVGRTQPDFSWVNDDYIINSGSVPNKYVRISGSERSISVPHGGSLTFSPGITDQSFDATIRWDAGGDIPEALCMHLASVRTGRIATGTLGEEYEVTSSACFSETPELSVTYHR